MTTLHESSTVIDALVGYRLSSRRHLEMVRRAEKLATDATDALRALADQLESELGDLPVRLYEVACVEDLLPGDVVQTWGHHPAQGEHWHRVDGTNRPMPGTVGVLLAGSVMHDLFAERDAVRRQVLGEPVPCGACTEMTMRPERLCTSCAALLHEATS